MDDPSDASVDERTEATASDDLTETEGSVGLGDLLFAEDATTLNELPPAPEFEIPDLGIIRLRDLPGPDGAPVALLLHGWTATSDLNFFRCYEALATHYRVIAYDHRGHGYGLRSRKTFRLEDAADDAAVVLDTLGIDSATVFGYSMGGAIAQLLWRQHPERVRGLVLGATAPYFSMRRDERLSFMGLNGLAKLARITPVQARNWLTEQFYLDRKEAVWGEEAMEQITRHDWRAILEAGHAIGDFNSADWLDEIDVPTSVIVTMRDPVVPLARQIELWEQIPDAAIFRVNGAHDAIVNHWYRFVPQLLRAFNSIDHRSVDDTRTTDHHRGGAGADAGDDGADNSGRNGDADSTEATIGHPAALDSSVPGTGR